MLFFSGWYYSVPALPAASGFYHIAQQICYQHM
jgi:hypothetical protein